MNLHLVKFLKRTETVEVYETYQFDDPDDDFEREPFSILISSKQQTNEQQTDLSPPTQYVQYLHKMCLHVTIMVFFLHRALEVLSPRSPREAI